jgi:Putative Ig domain
VPARVGVTHSVIVTGDKADVRLLLGGEDGALIERLSRPQRPRKELRRVPMREIPDRPADTIDRKREAHAIAGSGVSPRNTLNIHGEAAVGKSYALLRALEDEQWPFARKAVYVHAAGGLDDVLQAVFDAFYEQAPLAGSAGSRLRRDLARVRGPVILDQLELGREAAAQLQLALARCAIVVVSRERVILDDASALPIAGLEPEFSIALIEREIGRRLQADEHEPAQRICAALDGHPLRIREAVAPVRVDGRALTAIADLITGAGPREALAQARLAGADSEYRRLLATLALFGEHDVGREHLETLIDAPNADAVIDAAIASRDLRTHSLRVDSLRYTLGLTAADAARSLDLEAVGDRALSHFVHWAAATRAEPDAQLIESAALLALLRWALANGRLTEAIALGRAIDGAFAAGRRFDAWRQLLELVVAAAGESSDRAAEAWAVHQLGTRALALGELAAGTELLRRALAMRRELADRAGASVTERNLAASRRLARARQAIWRNPFLLLLVIGLIAAVVLSATESHHKTSPQNGGGPHNHNIVTVTSPGPQRTAENGKVALRIKVSDSAGAKLTYVAGGLPPGLGIERSTGLITGHPDRTGSYDVTVGADDHTGANDKAQFTWTVTP